MFRLISHRFAYIRNEDDQGQTLVEYGLLLALMAVVVIVALLFMGPIVSGLFQNVGNTIQGTPT